jgi:quinol monooxygenase YgiN
MVARVVTNQLKPGKMDEWINIARNSIVPAVKKEKGFKGFVILVDRSSGKSIGYSIWETETDLKANESSGFYQEQIAKLKDVLAMPPVREIYELTVLA